MNATTQALAALREMVEATPVDGRTVADCQALLGAISLACRLGASGPEVAAIVSPAVLGREIAVLERSHVVGRAIRAMADHAACPRSPCPGTAPHCLGVVGMPVVLVESPYAGDVERNVRFARACLADCFRRGEAGFASHLLYTQPGVLRDEVPAEREWGITAGLAVGLRADLTVVYTNLGISGGMRAGIASAERAGRPVEYRRLEGWQ